MFSTQQAQDLLGTTAVDANGDKIGKVGQIYLDDQTGQPEWVAVDTGLFGTTESLAPLQGATATDGGLRLAYPKDLVKNAPSVDADQHLDPAEEQRLYAHYSLDYGTGHPAGAGDDTAAVPHADDDEMTVSEERVSVGTERREAGRARLRKFVTTQTQTATVPVTHETAHIEREPITPENLDKALDGPEITENEYEVVLNEERPVVAKETVPVERVRLEKETVTEQQTVTEDARKERVETEGVADDRRL